MGPNKYCFTCEFSDCDRQKDGKIRCRRYSFWTDPRGGCLDHQLRVTPEARQLFSDATASMDDPSGNYDVYLY